MEAILDAAQGRKLTTEEKGAKTFDEQEQLQVLHVDMAYMFAVFIASDMPLRTAMLLLDRIYPTPPCLSLRPICVRIAAILGDPSHAVI